MEVPTVLLLVLIATMEDLIKCQDGPIDPSEWPCNIPYPCKDDEYYGDPDNCTVFYNCEPINHLYRYMCPQGLGWDYVDQLCYYVEDIICQPPCQSTSSLPQTGIKATQGTTEETEAVKTSEVTATQHEHSDSFGTQASAEPTSTITQREVTDSFKTQPSGEATATAEGLTTSNEPGVSAGGQTRGINTKPSDESTATADWLTSSDEPGVSARGQTSLINTKPSEESTRPTPQQTDDSTVVTAVEPATSSLLTEASKTMHDSTSAPSSTTVPGSREGVFSVQLSAFSYDFRDEDIIRFDNIHSDTSNGYDSGTGIYTCQNEGTRMYMISAFARFKGALQDDHILIVKDGTTILRLTGGVSDGTGGNMVVTWCSQSQRLWLVCQSRCEVFGQAYTTFSGIML